MNERKKTGRFVKCLLCPRPLAVLSTYAPRAQFVSTGFGSNTPDASIFRPDSLLMMTRRKGQLGDATREARAPCPSRDANAVRSMQTGARRIVQGSEVLISHLHKSKRVSKLGTRGAKQHAMRRKRGTVLLFRDEIDRSDSVFGNATPRAVRKVPARRSRATSHARVAEISAVGVGREKKAANLFAEKICGPACPKPKKFVVARLLSLKKCEPDPTGQDS